MKDEREMQVVVVGDESGEQIFVQLQCLLEVFVIVIVTIVIIAVVIVSVPLFFLFLVFFLEVVLIVFSQQQLLIFSSLFLSLSLFSPSSFSNTFRN